MTKRKKSYLMSGIMFLLILCLGFTGCSKEDQSKIDGFSYQDFKKAFETGALQCGEPFSLADSLIQEGEKASSMQVFFTDDSYMTLYMTPKNHLIKELNASIAIKDKAYAYAIIWSLEHLTSEEECKTFFDKIMAKKVGEKLESDSGFRYSHPESSEKFIGFTAIKTINK